MLGQDGKSSHSLTSFRFQSLIGFSNRPNNIVQVESQHKGSYAIPELVIVLSLKLMSASAECYRPKVIMLAVVGFPKENWVRLPEGVENYTGWQEY